MGKMAKFVEFVALDLLLVLAICEGGVVSFPADVLLVRPVALKGT